MVKLREVPAGSSKTPEPKRTSGGRHKKKSRLPALPGAGGSSDQNLSSAAAESRTAHSPSHLRLLSPHLAEYDQLAPPPGSLTTRSPVGSPPSSPSSLTRRTMPTSSPQKEKPKQAATLQWDFLPKISDSRYQPVALLVRESIKQKLEIARRSEAEQDALQTHVDHIIQEKRTVRKAKSKLTVAEAAMEDVKKWHRGTRLESVKESWKTHEKRVDEVRTRKWEADTNFIEETEASVQAKEQRHSDALASSRAKQWITACALVKLPLLLGKVVDKAREQQQFDEDKFQQRNRRKIPKPQCLAYYLTQQQQEHSEQRTRKPMPTNLLLNITQVVAVLFIIRRRQAKRRSTVLIAKALKNRNQVDAFPRAVRLFISRVTITQRLAKEYAVVALHRRSLLERQLLGVWNRVKRELVAKVATIMKDNNNSMSTGGSSSHLGGGPTSPTLGGSPKLKKQTSGGKRNGGAISPPPSMASSTNQNEAGGSLTPQQRWSQLGSLRQHHLSIISELLPPPEEMSSLIAGHFFVIRNQRFEMGRQFRQEIERFKHMKKILTQAVLLSTDASEGGRENPNYKLRNLKPPQLYFRQNLATDEVAQAQMEDLLKETLRREKLPTVLGELIEISQSGKAAVISHGKQMDELRVTTLTQIQRAKIRAEWLKSGGEGDDPSLSPLPSRLTSPAASPTLSSLAGGSVRGRGRGFEDANKSAGESPRVKSPAARRTPALGGGVSSRRGSKAPSISPQQKRPGDKRKSVGFAQNLQPSRSPPRRRSQK